MRICSFPGCPHDHRAHGLCAGHWEQRQAGKPLTPLRTYQLRRPRRTRAEINARGRLWRRRHRDEVNKRQRELRAQKRADLNYTTQL
jgi:hypothetical protein